MSEKRRRLTKSAIDGLPIPTVAEAGSAGYVIYWDTSVIGFGVQVRPSGTKTFILVYRNNQGHARRLTLGRYGRLTVDQAREAAKRHNGSVVLGGDPAAKKKWDRNSKTLDSVLGLYLEEYIIPHCSPDAARSVQRVRNRLRDNLGRIYISEIKASDVRNCLKDFRRHRGTYNLILTYVRATWNWARDHGHGALSEDARNPVSAIESMPSTPKAREVTAEEYQRVFKAIEEIISERRNDPARLLACLFVIETGCRPIEAIRLRRQKVFRERGIAELDEHKTFRRTGLPKRFFLTPAVIQILDRAEALHLLRNVESEYVFPRRSTQSASNWLAKTWKSVRKRANVDLELRQFRSGYINIADDTGMNENLISEITQHLSEKTLKRHYRVVKMKRAKENANLVSTAMDSFRTRNSAPPDRDNIPPTSRIVDKP